MNLPLNNHMRAVFNVRRNICLIVLALGWLCQLDSLYAVSLTDFGYQNLSVNGKLATGSRPLLALFVNFAGQTPLPKSISYYSNLVFNTSQTPSMNGYYQACSDGGLSLARGAAILLSLPASQRFEVYSNLYPPFTRDVVYASNIIAQAMISGQLNFASYDANHDGHITPDELSILIVTSDVGELGFGGSRTSPTVSVPGANYDWGSGPNDPYPNVAMIGSNPPFIVWCEELEETWGASDIYGPDQLCLSMTLSPQSCFYDTSSLIGSYYYLDPWNRMELGWCQPRIYSLTAGGSATISAAQAGDPTSPIILYDPAQGTSEFFILEYRTSTNSVYGSGYDKDAGNDGGDPVSYGLVIWHIQQDSNHNFTYVTSPSGVTNTPAVWAENSPNLIPSEVPVLWGSNSTTPALKWISGAQTVTTVHVQPFNLGDNSITVQWLSAEDTWVDFNFTGTPNGTFSNPYTTMAAGIAACSYGGNLHVKTGTSSETPTITKPMHIVGYNGPANIGN
jgi:hypothetical protein